MLVSQSYITETARVSFLNEAIIEIAFKSDKLVSLNDAKEIDQILMEISNGNGHFVIINALDIESNMQYAAQRYLAREALYAQKVKAVAILLNNLPIRLTASMFIKFQQPLFDTKIFANEREARNWFDKQGN